MLTLVSYAQQEEYQLGVSKKVKVILHDGIMTDGVDMFTITYSNDEIKYKESLTKLEQNQSRYMDIQVLNMKGEEIINTYQLETLINEYLLQILNNK
jgi:hypothetical protein